MGLATNYVYIYIYRYIHDGDLINNEKDYQFVIFSMFLR